MRLPLGRLLAAAALTAAPSERSFRQHTACEPCVAAGFGWSVRLGKCGGYANQLCGGGSSGGGKVASAVDGTELATALSFLDELLAEGGGDAAGGTVDAKVARARQLLRDRTAAAASSCAAAAPEPASTSPAAAAAARDEWRPSARDAGQANDLPKLSPLAWTPLWSAPTSSALNLDALRAHILADRTTNPGLQKSNDGGFHSEGDMLDSALSIKTPVLRAFRKEIFRHVHAHLRALAVATNEVGGPGETSRSNRPYRINIGTTWYNMNSAGHYNNLHTHDGSHISGVLYLDDGGDPTACTKFYDVRGQKAELGPQKLGGGDAAGLFRPVWGGTNAPVQICPQVGTLVLFPAWLQHAVLPHEGNSTRTSISWNLVLEERRPGGSSETPVDLDWPTALSGADDRADSMALAGGEASIPKWSPRSGVLGDLPPGGVAEGSAVAPRGLSMYWPTPVRPNVLPHGHHPAFDALRKTLLRFEKKARDGGVRRGREGFTKRGVLGASTASAVRPAIHSEIYWYVYEMLLPARRRGEVGLNRGASGGEGVAINVDIIDSSAHVTSQAVPPRLDLHGPTWI